MFSTEGYPLKSVCCLSLMMPLNSTSNMHKYAPANQNDRGEAGDKLPPHQIPRKADDANGSIEMQKRSHKNKEGPLTIAGDPAELRVFYTGRRGMALPCRRTRTEKYLIALCLLLFCACITFIVIAFARDSGGPGFIYLFIYLKYLYVFFISQIVTDFM